MRIAVQPFFSQQDKRTGLFLLDGCLTMRISLFLANRAREAGHEVVVFLPKPHQCAPWAGTELPVRTRRVPQSNRLLSNKLQRLDFDAAWFEEALDDVDMLITCNELLPAKVRHVFGGKIAALNNLFPMGGWEWMQQLQREAWRIADTTAFMSTFIRAVYSDEVGNFRVWPMVFDATKVQHSSKKDIDVLFVQRCSVSNYTHHEEFLQTLPLLSKLNVVFADPTGYLEKSRPDLQYAHAFGDDYYNLLSRTRVVVALMTGDIHGGTSTREAIMSGANPVLLRYPHYEDLVGIDDFSGFCSLDPVSIAIAVHRQMANPAPQELRDKIAKESYQATWPTVKRDLCL